MPDLAQSLQGRDLGHLRIVAGLCGLDLNAPDTRVGLQRLLPTLLARSLVAEMVASLPGDARAALEDLLRNEGRLAWPLFTRRYGAVREMGPGRRDREKPHLNPASLAEFLWYRALVGRAFLDGPDGPQEFAYIPDDLLALLPGLEEAERGPLGRPASPAERAAVIPAGDRLLDHACTLLAALRLGLPETTATAPWEADSGASGPALTPAALQGLLAAAGLLDPAGFPLPEPVRAFLEAERGEALAILARAWLHSPTFNELRLMPGIAAEGDWQNDPLRARQAILDFLATVPGAGPARREDEPGYHPFWSLAAFVSAVRQSHPDYQRPAGDYDSWFIRDLASGEFLRGFEHWEEVDGALIRYLIAGPLHWLGMVDLAATAPGARPAAFRFTPWAQKLLAGEAPAGLPKEDEALVVRSDAQVWAPPLAPRAVRYQIARFGEWDPPTPNGYPYRLTPASLERARQGGLRVAHLLALLRRHAPAVPPVLVRALERWDERGTEARLEQVVVLRLSSPDLLQALRGSRAARFLGDPLGPTAVIIKAGAWKKVQAVLAEMGFLAEVRWEGTPAEADT